MTNLYRSTDDGHIVEVERYKNYIRFTAQGPTSQGEWSIVPMYDQEAIDASVAVLQLLAPERLS